MCFDEKARGLAVMVYPTGSMTYIHYRKVRKSAKRTTLGDIRAYTVEQARDWAWELNTKIAHWKQADYTGVSPIAKPKKDPTLREVKEHYVEHHLPIAAKNPTYSIKRFNWQFDRYLSSLAEKRLGQILRADVKQLHQQVKQGVKLMRVKDVADQGGVTAYHAVKQLRTLFNYALDPDVALWEGVNPARSPGKKILFQEVPRDRVLHENEAPKFFAAIQDEQRQT